MALNRENAVEGVVADILDFFHHYGFSSAFLREAEKLYQEHVVAPEVAKQVAAEENAEGKLEAPAVAPGVALVPPEQPATPAVPPSPGQGLSEPLPPEPPPASVGTDVETQLAEARARVAELEAQESAQAGNAETEKPPVL